MRGDYAKEGNRQTVLSVTSLGGPTITILLTSKGAREPARKKKRGKNKRKGCGGGYGICHAIQFKNDKGFRSNIVGVGSSIQPIQTWTKAI